MNGVIGTSDLEINMSKADTVLQFDEAQERLTFDKLPPAMQKAIKPLFGGLKIEGDFHLRGKSYGATIEHPYMDQKELKEIINATGFSLLRFDGKKLVTIVFKK